MTFELYKLNQLVIADENVRAESEPDGDINALAELIATQGLQQPLCGYPKGKTKLAIFDGRRRLLALRQLAKEGRLPSDCMGGVPCRVASKEHAREISLSIGVSHKSFHPAEEYKAFAALIDEGRRVEDVAKRFSITENQVLRRLKLARLAPCIFYAFARDEISLAQAQAFALTDDHDRQRRIWDAQGARVAPAAIRRSLTENEVPASDKRARYIGKTAYEEAGGTIRRDLFEEAPDMFCDAPLLDALVDAKLEADAIAIKGEGWSWVVCTHDFDSGYHQSHYRVHGTPVPFCAEEQQSYDALTAERDALLQKAEEEGDESDEVWEKYDLLEEKISALEEAQLRFTEEDLARGGAVVFLSHDGLVQVVRGLVERKAETKTASALSSMPHAQHRRLTEIATQGLARDLAKNWRAADIVLTAALLHQTLGNNDNQGVGIVVDGLKSSAGGDLPVDQSLAVRQEYFVGLIGQNLADTLFCIARLSDDERAEAKAMAVALSLDFSEHRADSRASSARQVASFIAELVGTDLRKHWTADRDYFSKLRADVILENLAEMGASTSGLGSAKKKELVVIAAREAAAHKTWTPEPARFANAFKGDETVAKAA